LGLYAEIPYGWEALFAAGRISLWFILLFGFVSPLFLDHTRKLPAIEKLIYSWVGLGGIIVVSVFVLTMLQIYDFISLILTLLLIPIIRHIWKSEKGILEYLKDFELRSVIYQIKFIERFEGIEWQKWKQEFTFAKKKSGFEITRTFLVLSIALIGGLTRMYPALMNAAPFSRGWYFELNRVKNLQLQNYFSGSPEPPGMHSLVSVFSMLTQLSPEMILHLLGALTSFFLCILIYWSLCYITKNEVYMAPILGMSIYAVIPLLLMPISLDLQIEAHSLDLALCFALPTLIIFLRNLRNEHESTWFYVLSGFIATGMTNLFVSFIILLPLMVLSLITIPRKDYTRTFFKIFGYLVTMSIIVVLPLLIYNYLFGYNQYSFILEQLLAPQVFMFNPEMLIPVEKLSIYFLAIALVVMIGYIIESELDEKKGIRDEIFFLIIFIFFALLYTPYIHNFTYWIDPDQFDLFYSLLIAVFIGVVFATLMRWTNRLLKLENRLFQKIGFGLYAIVLVIGMYVQGGIKVSRQLPSTVPNGFHESYYNIISDFLPYSYAIVAPEIERITAKNRHYFMNYHFFLEKYDRLDNLYRQQLAAPDTVLSIPPASIFVFIEKPPYGAIQQGILYDTPTVMRNMQQWIERYRETENRTVKTYYEDEQSIVYQIINRIGESEINQILWNIYPENN
jgi:hypothetical protein